MRSSEEEREGDRGRWPESGARPHSCPRRRAHEAPVSHVAAI
ncbi:hypothetical protein [Rubrobacter aplysinae]|nr:hypothetical protein [Rubrobacter aplysinae]